MMVYMLQRFLRKIQHPLVIAAILFAMIIGLVLYLTYSESVKNRGGQSSGVEQLEELRDGSQKIGINIAPADGTGVVTNGYDLGGDAGAVSGKRDVSIMGSTGAMSDSSIIVEDSGGRLEFVIDNFKKLTTQPLKFKIFGEDGRELAPDFLSTLYGEKVHFYLLNANLNEFNHLLPSYSDGYWTVSAPMPTQGTYYAFVVFDSLIGPPIALSHDLIVREASSLNINKPDPTSGLTFDNGSNSVELKVTRGDDERRFDFRITSGEELSMVDPIYESLGLMVVVGHSNPPYFALVGDNGLFDGSAGHIVFDTGLLTPGRYTVFAEFKTGSDVGVYPVTFDIGRL